MQPLDPKSVSKFKNQLTKPPVFKPIRKINKKGKSYDFYKIKIKEFKQQVLPANFSETTVWGYEGILKGSNTQKSKSFRSFPGATFEATRGIPIQVKWVNCLKNSHLLPVDPTIHWANPNNIAEPEPPFPPFPPGFPQAQEPVPTVTHLHGGEVRSDFDGGPTSWFTANEEIIGPGFFTTCYKYPNEQQPATLWYHDHVLGITRLNVYTGLAGFYLLRDPDDKIAPLLPEKDYEIPIVIQDRSFYEDGSLRFPHTGINPDIHPYWLPEFVGDIIVVNGKTWPNLDVERRQYRFRLLNGSNARFYRLKLSNQQSFIQIGTDGGYLPFPVELSELVIAPGERADILIDFSLLAPGTRVILLNDANTPFPDGDPVDPNTTGQIMQFSVVNTSVIKPNKLPDTLNTIPELKPNKPNRILTLVEVMGSGGPIEILLDGQKWGAPLSELPEVGSTEEWEIVNLTEDTHPIHLHLVQFLIKNRQKIDSETYLEEWIDLNGEPPLDHQTIPLELSPFLQGNPMVPDENELGWKDTVQMNPGEVTRITVRFAPQDAKPHQVKPGVNLFPFDPTFGPGYVWHCHILDHEDNEMMRPYKVIKKEQPHPESKCTFKQMLKVNFDAIFTIDVDVDNDSIIIDCDQ